MDQQQQQRQIEHFKGAFSRASAHAQDATKSVQGLVHQLAAVVASEGVSVTSAIHTPMLRTEKWQNVLAEITFSHPKGFAPVAVHLLYGASIGTETSSFVVKAMCGQRRYDAILHATGHGQVVEDSEKIRELLRDVATGLWGFSAS